MRTRAHAIGRDDRRDWGALPIAGRVGASYLVGVPTTDRDAAVDEALRRLHVEVPRSAAEAAKLRSRTRDLDRALGALMRPDTNEEA